MKKFVAILTALMFALSLGVAVAQEKAPAGGEAKKEAPAKKIRDISKPSEQTTTPQV